MKLYLGCALPPIHPQHYKMFPDLDNWVWADLFIDHERVKKWDARNLPVEDNSIEILYNSHLLEHISHPEVGKTLLHWYNKLQDGGELVINVPDLEWAARQVITYEAGQVPDGLFNEWFGKRGLLNIFYGTHDHPGEYHMSGYTKTSLTEILEEVGFTDIKIEQLQDAHQMGVLLVRCKK